MQRTKRPSAIYMEALQPDVTPAMRAILVDWMVEVAQEYKLHSETLFQAVGLVDRYLSIIQVPRNHLQLIGVTCMLLSSKYEEIYSPQVWLALHPRQATLNAEKSSTCAMPYDESCL